MKKNYQVAESALKFLALNICLFTVTQASAEVQIVPQTNGISHSFEEIEKDELQNTAFITAGLNKVKAARQKRLAATGDASADQGFAPGRLFHSKGHGCIRSTFTVLPLEEQYREGVFSTPATYNSYMRLSNGAAGKADGDKDVRGVAIKVLLPDDNYVLTAKQNNGLPESDTGNFAQDFLLITGPAVFLDSVQTIKDLLIHMAPKNNARSQSRFTKHGFLLNAKESIHKKIKFMSFFLKRRKSDGLIMMKNASKSNVKIDNPFDPLYNSGSIYAFGEDAAARYSLKRINCPSNQQAEMFQIAATSRAQKRNPNFLAEQIPGLIDANSPDICMGLDLQIRFDKQSAEVERPHIAWEDTESVPAAVLRISPPENAGLLSLDACNSMSFKPWNSLQAHRPVGGINRLRKAIYHNMYNDRMGKS